MFGKQNGYYSTTTCFSICDEFVYVFEDRIYQIMVGQLLSRF